MKDKLREHFMKKLCDYVDVFMGTGKCAPQKDGTLYSKWNNFKGKAGNTTPAACLPFGAVSCNPYSGAYSSGYGNNAPNSGEPIKDLFVGDKLIGFAHFSHSGVGGIGIYYNYLLTVPFISDFSDKIFSLKDIDEEKGEPGYYSCRFKESNIQAEVTVSGNVAVHRYKVLDGKPLKIAIDVSNDGLRILDKKWHSFSEQSEIYIAKNGTLCGFVIMQGVKIYFAVSCPNSKLYLWKNGIKLKEEKLSFKHTEERFGCVFELAESTAELKVAFSLENTKSAEESLQKAMCFEKTRVLASELWEKRLSSIELTDATEEAKKTFYSNFYHALIKPCGWQNESFLWKEDAVFYFDFATMWDIYKTQTPLLFSLYEDVGRGIVKTLIRYGKEYNKLFNCLLLSTDMNVESQQACCLGAYVLYDAYMRGMVDDVDGMFNVVKSEIDLYKDAYLNNDLPSFTKYLDIAWIVEAYANLAKELGRTDEVIYFTNLIRNWKCLFAEDGLLGNQSKYYEGNRWNYSFRLTPYVEERVALIGGKAETEKKLDAFFAFNDENERHNRFEGFNNETDMETPYFYHYVGNKEKLQRILEECINVCFRDGRDGLPGNEDSGGLSSCYIWNFLGLFPVTGQDIMMLGFPSVKETVIRFYNGNKLIVKRCGEGKSLMKVLFNKKETTDYFLKVQDVLKGGILEFIYN